MNASSFQYNWSSDCSSRRASRLRGSDQGGAFGQGLVGLFAGFVKPFDLRGATLFIYGQQIIAHDDGRLVDPGSNLIQRAVSQEVVVALRQVAGADLFERPQGIAAGHQHQEQEAPESCQKEGPSTGPLDGFGRRGHRNPKSNLCVHLRNTVYTGLPGWAPNALMEESL